MSLYRHCTSADVRIGSSEEMRVRATLNTISPVHAGDKVEFDTVDSVESRQSRPCRFGPVHAGDKSQRDVRRSGDRVDRIGDKNDRVGDNVDRDEQSNSKPATNRRQRRLSPILSTLSPIRSTLSPMCRRFQRLSPLSPMCAGL